ncbi:MAG: methyltransferase, partial [Pseudomonadota bacterium]
EAQNESKTKETGFFETLYAEPARLEAFMAAMNGSSLHAFTELARAFPFEAYQSVTDIGGADALLSRLLARAHEHLECTSFDLPEVTAIAQRRVAEDSLEQRIKCVSGDFFQDQFPSADVITMGMILHDWDLEQKKHLIQMAYETLEPGGALVVIEALIDDARRENTYGLFMSLTMLMEFGDRAFDFSAAEFETWAREIGFTRFENYSLTGITRAVVAYK